MRNKLTSKQFQTIFSIMEKSFPEGEIRTFEKQSTLLSDNRYNIITKSDENNEIIGFIAYWEFKNFIYVEHFALLPENRGRGEGTALLKELVKSASKIIVLEIEFPIDSESKRRLAFYERQGFIGNNYAYIQPSMRSNTLPVPMKLMSYAKRLERTEFEEIKQTLYREVYQLKDSTEYC